MCISEAGGGHDETCQSHSRRPVVSSCLRPRRRRLAHNCDRSWKILMCDSRYGREMWGPLLQEMLQSTIASEMRAKFWTYCWSCLIACENFSKKRYCHHLKKRNRRT